MYIYSLFHLFLIEDASVILRFQIFVLLKFQYYMPITKENFKGASRIYENKEQSSYLQPWALCAFVASIEVIFYACGLSSVKQFSRFSGFLRS